MRSGKNRVERSASFTVTLASIAPNLAVCNPVPRHNGDCLAFKRLSGWVLTPDGCLSSNFKSPEIVHARRVGMTHLSSLLPDCVEALDDRAALFMAM